MNYMFFKYSIKIFLKYFIYYTHLNLMFIFIFILYIYVTSNENHRFKKYLKLFKQTLSYY